MTTAVEPSPAGLLGGCSADADGVNAGMLRCPRCSSRLLSQKGLLVERSGADAALWTPKATGLAEAEPAPADQAESYDWSETTHPRWWMVEDVNDVDNVALTLSLPSPRGACRMALCSDCRCGPLGYQLDGDAQLWFAAGLLRQQDALLANDAEDFKMPDGLDMASLKAMIESGQATVAYKATFEERWLGMMLQDAADGMSVELTAFTEHEGQAGPVELSGKVKLGDKVVRVNGKSTRGCDYAAVLEMIIGAPRPLTLHWERQGNRSQEAARVSHADWKPRAGEAATPGEER